MKNEGVRISNIYSKQARGEQQGNQEFHPPYMNRRIFQSAICDIWTLHHVDIYIGGL